MARVPKQSINNKQEVTTPIVQEDNSTINPIKINPIKVSGYDDVELNDDLFNFLSDKISTYNNDDNIKSQFTNVLDFYKAGNLHSIDETGAGSGEFDKSLMNKRASKLKSIWGSNKDYDKQQAALQLNNWIRDYAKIKKDKFNKDNTLDFSFDLKNQIGSDLGSWNDDYWKNLSTSNRLNQIKQSIGNYLNKFDNLNYNKDLHLNIDENRFNYLKNNREVILNDILKIQDVNKNGEIDADELANYSKTHGINMYDLLKIIKNPISTSNTTLNTTPSTSVNNNVDTNTTVTISPEKITEVENKLQDLESQNITTSLDDSFDNLTDEEKIDFLEDPKNFKINYTGYYTPNPYDKNYNFLKSLEGRWYNGRRLQDDEINEDYNKEAYENLKSVLATSGIHGNRRINYPSNVQNVLNSKHEDSAIYDSSNMYDGGQKIIAFADKTGDRISQAILTPNGYVKIKYIEPSITNNEYIATLENGERYKLGNITQQGLSQVGLTGLKEFGRNNGSPRGINYNVKNSSAFPQNPQRINHVPRPLPNSIIASVNQNVSKMQFGGVITKHQADEETTNKYNEKAIKEKQRSASWTELTDTSNDFKLTTSDKIKLGSLVADIGGLVGTLAPGVGNVAGGISGALGTIGNATADFMDQDKTDKSTGKIIGEGLLGLAFDVGTLIPGIGTGVKVGKVLNGVKKASKVLSTAFAAAGLTEFINTVNKISSDKQVTIDELRSLLSGIHTITGGAKAYTSVKNKRLKADYNFNKGNDNYNIEFKNKKDSDEFKTKANELLTLRAKGKVESKAAKSAEKSIDDVLKKATVKISDGKGDVITSTSASWKDIESNIPTSNFSTKLKFLNKGKLDVKPELTVESASTWNTGDNRIDTFIKNRFRKSSNDVPINNTNVNNNEYKFLNELSSKSTDSENVRNPIYPEITYSSNKPVDNTSSKLTNDKGYRLLDKLEDRFRFIGSHPFNKPVDNTSTSVVTTPITNKTVTNKSNGNKVPFNQGKFRPVVSKTKPVIENKTITNTKSKTSKENKVISLTKQLDDYNFKNKNDAKKYWQKEVNKLRNSKNTNTNNKEKIDLIVKIKKKAEKNGVIIRKNGGILKYENGGTINKFNTSSANKDSFISKALNFGNKLISPQTLKLTNTLITNARMMDEMKQAPKMTLSSPLPSVKLPNVNISNQITRDNYIKETLNSNNNIYSDPKLNNVNSYSKLGSLNKYKLDSDVQNQQVQQSIDQYNNNLENRDRSIRSEVVNKNKELDYTRNMQQLQSKLGLRRATGDSISNFLDEIANKRNIEKQVLNQLSLDKESRILESKYQPQLANVNAKYNLLAKNANLSLSDYFINNPDMLTARDNELKQIKDKYFNDLNSYKYKLLTK